MLGAEPAGDVLEEQLEAEAQHGQVVHLAQEWDHVRDEVERRERVDESGAEDQLWQERRSRVAQQPPRQPAVSPQQSHELEAICES